MPVGEPQPSLGYPCKGGPLDGRMLAHNGTVYHVSSFDNAPALHARTPFVFGSAEKVSRVAAYHDLPDEEVSALFGNRGLFRS